MRSVYYVLPFFVTVHYVVAVVSNEMTFECITIPMILLGISYSLFRTIVHSNPGIAPKTVVVDEQCRKCGRKRVEKVFHCPICNVCVEGFDHHCDVLDVCIGDGNISVFRAFLLYHALMCLYGCILHIRIVQRHLRQPITGYIIVMIMVEMVFSISFTLFWLFHKGLAMCDVRTIDIIHKCRLWFQTKNVIEVNRVHVSQRKCPGDFSKKIQ